MRGHVTATQRARHAVGYGRQYPIVGRSSAAVIAGAPTVSWWVNPVTFYAEAKVAAARMAARASLHTYGKPVDGA